LLASVSQTAEHIYQCMIVSETAFQALAAAGASILYLPPYSPDLNPIEQLLAKLKALLRKAAATTKDQRWSTIARLLDSGPPLACANYLKHCGYGST
jgi:transposase